MTKYRKPQLNRAQAEKLQDVMDMFRYAPEDRYVTDFSYLNNPSTDCFKPQVYFYSFRRPA